MDQKTKDDAAVYKLTDQTAIVKSLDFLYFLNLSNLNNLVAGYLSLGLNKLLELVLIRRVLISTSSQKNAFHKRDSCHNSQQWSQSKAG